MTLGHIWLQKRQIYEHEKLENRIDVSIVHKFSIYFTRHDNKKLLSISTSKSLGWMVGSLTVSDNGILK